MTQKFSYGAIGDRYKKLLADEKAKKAARKAARALLPKVSVKDCILALPHVEDVDRDGADGLWFVYFKDGWCSNDDPCGSVHMASEETLTKLLRSAKDVRVCTCEGCTKGKTP